MRTVEAFKGMKQSVFHRNLGGDGAEGRAMPLSVG